MWRGRRGKRRNTSRPCGGRHNDIVRWNQRVHRDMRPSESIEVQEHRLRVLNLRKREREFVRHIQVKRRYAGEPRHALPGNTWFGFDHELLTFVQRRHQNDLLDSFNPEDRGHPGGLSVGRWGWDCGLAQQKRDVVRSAAEKPDGRRGSRGNEDGGCAGDDLLADLSAQ